MPAVATASKNCRHCGRPRSLRRRGLCWGCYFEPGVREQYRPTSVMANRGVGVAPARVRNEEEVRRALLPCPHWPGSAERIETVVLRVKYHLPVKVPADAGMVEDAVDRVDWRADWFEPFH